MRSTIGILCSYTIKNCDEQNIRISYKMILIKRIVSCLRQLPILFDVIERVYYVVLPGDAVSIVAFSCVISDKKITAAQQTK